MSHENGKTKIELYDTRTQKIRPIFSQWRKNMFRLDDRQPVVVVSW